MASRFNLSYLSLAIMAAASPTAFAAQAADLPADGSEPALELQETQVLGSAEEELKQAPGVSIITADDIAKRPPANDLSDVIRRMPGVNLTGNSASGSRGNNRQIDLRGMGPENTLILIDGKPVTSRNSVRYTRSGERDTRGDSNWVPADQVERIEVLRGPAAARYGSGSMGGVVNIITKRPSEQTSGSITAYTSIPEDSDEGGTRRSNFSLSGPLTEGLVYRVYGNVATTDADSATLNQDHSAFSCDGALCADAYAAGREGVRNKDINGLLSWQLNDQQTLDVEAGYSRQGNIYAGDTATGSSNGAANANAGEIAQFIGRETNTMFRNTYSVTHQGDWDFGTSKVYAQYEKTRNYRMLEGNVGGGDGNIGEQGEAPPGAKDTSTYQSYVINGQLDIPLEAWVHQVLTVGAEWNRQTLDDPSTFSRDINLGNFGSVDGIPAAGALRSSEMDATLSSVFVEDNLELTPDWVLTPGLRLDHHDQFGANWSPSLNTSFKLTPEITVKGGIARAFKAPNLYQSNPNYLYFTMGMGCPAGISSAGGCYVLGNDNLDPEISINKELGIAFNHDGWNAGITYFRNDYDSKIAAGYTPTGTASATGGQLLRWENTTDAVVEGFEGNLNIPLIGTAGDVLIWNNNFTYMLDNTDQDGQPLSVIPEYTVNTSLDWQATEQLNLVFSGTFYGVQKPRDRAFSTNAATAGATLKERDPYNVWGLSATYAVNRHLRVGAGVSNLFDKRLYREGAGSSQGANTYNEPGRAFFASVTTSF